MMARSSSVDWSVYALYKDRKQIHRHTVHIIESSRGGHFREFPGSRNITMRIVKDECCWRVDSSQRQLVQSRVLGANSNSNVGRQHPTTHVRPSPTFTSPSVHSQAQHDINFVSRTMVAAIPRSVCHISCDPNGTRRGRPADETAPAP